VEKPEKRILAIDCETDPFLYGRIPEPFVWGAYDGRRFRSWRSTAAFARWLANQDAVAFAHNGGKFDFFYLLEYVENGEIFIINRRMARLRIGRCELRDSMLIIPIALGKYKKDEMDYTTFERPVRESNMAGTLRYLEGDCRYLYELVSTFIDEHGIDTVTIGQGAVNAIRGKCALPKIETSEQYFKNMRKFYKGGRVQARVGEYSGPIYDYDISSAYPSAMKTGPLPWGGVFEYTEINRPAKKERINLAGFYNIVGKSDHFFPVLVHGKTQYPKITGEFSVTGHELKMAVEAGFTGRVISRLIPETCTDFHEFVDYYYARKRKYNRDDPEYWIAKLLLNSGYGKFGSNPTDWENYLLSEWGHEHEHDGEGYTLVGRLGGRPLISRPLQGREMRWLDIAVAASTTGAVRARLFPAMDQCGLENIIGCDTDGFLSLHPLPNSWLERSGLGAWELEEVWDRAWIAGKKMYALQKGDKIKVRSKGVRLTKEQIVQLVKGEKVTHQRDNPTYSMTRGIHFISRTINSNVNTGELI
jgi:DNA polymerase elongation subunit (family B)